MNELQDLTPVFMTLLTLLFALVSAFVVPWVKSKTTEAQRKELSAWVSVAVRAAEQIYTGTGRGAEKKEYVSQWLRERGYTIDLDELDALIESAVYDLTKTGTAGT